MSLLSPNLLNSQEPHLRDPLQITTNITGLNQCNVEIVNRAKQAWQRLQHGQSWRDWLQIGAALEFLRNEALHEAHTNAPTGSRYADTFSRRMVQCALDEVHKSVRSRLFECLQHRAEIEAWRDALPLNQRLKLNHPTTVLRHWREATKPPEKKSNKTLSPVATLKAVVVQLEEDNDRLKRAGDDLFAPTDSVENITLVIADRLSRLTPNKAAKVLADLPKVFKDLKRGSER
jgi:hypothetical protein